MKAIDKAIRICDRLMEFSTEQEAHEYAREHKIDRSKVKGYFIEVPEKEKVDPRYNLYKVKYSVVKNIGKKQDRIQTRTTEIVAKNLNEAKEEIKKRLKREDSSYSPHWL